MEKKNLTKAVIVGAIFGLILILTDKGCSGDYSREGTYHFNVIQSSVKLGEYWITLNSDETAIIKVVYGSQGGTPYEYKGRWVLYGSDKILVESLNGEKFVFRDNYVYDGFDNANAKNNGMPFTKTK